MICGGHRQIHRAGRIPAQYGWPLTLPCAVKLSIANNDGILAPGEFDQPGYDRPWYCWGIGSVNSKDANGDGQSRPGNLRGHPQDPIDHYERMTLRFGGKTSE